MKEGILVGFLLFFMSQLCAATWGAMDYTSVGLPKLRENCERWPQTVGGLLVPGYKVGCTAAKLFTMPLEDVWNR